MHVDKNMVMTDLYCAPNCAADIFCVTSSCPLIIVADTREWQCAIQTRINRSPRL